MSLKQELGRTFTEKAELVSAVVVNIADYDQAVAYAMDLCGKKEACKLLASGCELPLSNSGEALCDDKQQKVVAAPALKKNEYRKLAAACEDNGFKCIDSGMRDHLAGIDIALTHADAGIAETGSLMLDSSGEELRLATMIAEYHVCILPVSKIKKDAFAVERMLKNRMGKTPNYTAFITGASRTADIERVLALGVHGPLELHILLLED